MFLNYEKKLVISVYIVRQSVDEWHFGHRFFRPIVHFQRFVFCAHAVHNIIKYKYNTVTRFKHYHKNI